VEKGREEGAKEGDHETKSRTHVQLSGEACEARLTINGRKHMEGELFWFFYDDVFSSWIPPNHMMVFKTFEKTFGKERKEGLD
jgi:hypothetical protein